MPFKTFLRARSGIGHFHEVTVAGGEPTLHPKFWQMIERIISKKPQWLQVISNGVSFSKTQASAKAWLSRLESLAQKAGVPVYVRVSVDDFHTRGLKGGAKEVRKRVRNILRAEPESRLVTVGFCSHTAPKQSERALLEKYGLPREKTFVGVWSKAASGGTVQTTLITPEGRVYARESHMVQGQLPLGNLKKEPLGKIRRRRF
jgi:hypothetical protein